MIINTKQTFDGFLAEKKGSTGTGVMSAPSTGISVVNKINLLRKSLLRYQCFNNGIKSKKVAFFDFGVTTWKTMNKWQKEGCFTTSVPVDPKKMYLSTFFYPGCDRIIQTPFSEPFWTKKFVKNWF